MQPVVRRNFPLSASTEEVTGPLHIVREINWHVNIQTMTIISKDDTPFPS